MTDGQPEDKDLQELEALSGAEPGDAISPGEDGEGEDLTPEEFVASVLSEWSELGVPIRFIPAGVEADPIVASLRKISQALYFIAKKMDALPETPPKK